MNVFQRVKAHLLKVTLTIAAALLIVQYWRYSVEDTHPFQPLFIIDSIKSKMTASDDNLTAFDPAEDLNSTSAHNSSLSPAPASASAPSPLPHSHPPTTTHLPNDTLCPPVPPDLTGPIDIITTPRNIADLEDDFRDLDPGGMHRPKECKARYVVALVIPYRDRVDQLSIFLSNIHRLLMKQQLDYGVFVVEQDGNDPFNRGKLMNVGFVEASKVKDFDCFIFHDVDLIPENDMNLYTCPEQPRHMSVAINKFNYKLPYVQIFGGVCALTKEHFKLTNGFSNSFWGWGAEDDDMFNRVRRQGLHVSRYPPTIARYTMLPHERQKPNPKRFEIMQRGKQTYRTDGLSSLDYERKAIEFKRLYTWILVDLHPPR